MKTYFIYFVILFLTTQTFAQWTELNTGAPFSLNTVSAVDDNIVWVAGGTNNVYRTTNGGSNWSSASGTGMGLHHTSCIFAIDANNALIGTGDPQLLDTACLFKTTNGGATWILTWGTYGAFIDGIYIKNSSEGFFIGDPFGGSWLMRKTADGGSTWTTSAIIGSTDFGDNNSIYGIGDRAWFGGGHVNYSTNMGSNWSMQTVPGLNEISAIFFENSATGMCGGPGGIDITTNSGVSWNSLIYPGTGYVNGIAGYGNTWIITKYGRNAYISTDNGLSWNLDYSAPSGLLRNHMIKSRNGSKIWDVRDNGTVGRRDSPLRIRIIQNQLPLKSELIGNFPNPFNPETQIKFSVNKTGKVTIEFFDLNGKAATELLNREFTPGVYEVSFNSNGLSSGVYFYRMKTGEYTQTRKMVILK